MTQQNTSIGCSRIKEEFQIKWHTGHGSADGSSFGVLGRAPNSASKVPLASLVDIEALRQILDDLAVLEGIATAVLDLEGRILQSAGWQGACTKFHRAVSSSGANCTESDLFLASHLRNGEFVDYKCKNGLWDVVTPVFVGDQHLANLYCGQFFYDDDQVDEAYFIAQAAANGYDETAYLAAIREIPRFSRTRVRQVMGLIVNLASYLSQLSLTNLRLRESQGQMEALINALPDPIWLKDTQGHFLACNRAFERMLGNSADRIVGRTDHDFFPEAIASFFRRKDEEALAAGQPSSNEEWIPVASTGESILVETVKAPLPGMTGEPVGVLGIARDITERKQAEDHLRLMSKVFSNSGEAILITDSNNRILAVNKEFTKLTGYSPEEVYGRNPSMLSAGNGSREVYEEMWSSLAANDYWQGELWDRRKSGDPYPKRLSISVVRDERGNVTNYIGLFQDITKTKAAEDKIRHLAHHDALTGLPNRFSLYQRMEQSIAFARRFDKRVAVLLIDLDRFKSINDTLGHNVGDQLLIQVASRLSQSVRQTDIVARLGGDEFVIVLTGIELGRHATEIADKIVQQISLPYSIAGHVLRTSPSVGICLCPDDALEINDLIKNADIAMYQAKALGRGNYQCYTEGMRAEVARRVTAEKELEAALDQGQFVLHYQPQIDLATGSVTGMEALIRWQHPSRGLVFPGDFIPVAEETNLIIPLGKWVLEEACRQLKDWHQMGLAHLTVSVNLSAVQFEDIALPTLVANVLETCGLPPHSLHLEITESMAMRRPEDSIRMMNTLADIGVKLALDDFGTGYSSLAYLKLFPLDIIKIDRAFVKDLETDENNAAICEMTMLLAQKLGKRVVAEGVETEDQRRFLSEIGCQEIQGYLYSKPLPAPQAAAFACDLASADVQHFPAKSV